MEKHYGLTDEESELIVAAVMLPMVLSVVERNKAALEHEKLSLKKLYVIATDVLIARIKEEIARVKKELWRHEVKVILPRPEEPLGYAYACRGLANQMIMTKEQAQQDISLRLERFIRELKQGLTAVK